MTSDTDFKVTTFFEVDNWKTALLKEKVTMVQVETIYLTYGMVLCLVSGDVD